MSTISWTLSSTPAQIPEYWLLFVDGLPCTALVNQAPYVGPGTYSVDLTQLDAGSPVPDDGAAHSYSVALVGGGVIGPQSPTVLVTLPLVAISGAVSAQQSQAEAPSWPAADTLTST